MNASAAGCEAIMSFDYLLGGGLAALLLVYLTVALARPEKF
ncbi:MAG: potassium-transporting ATPase subunit F [Rhodospirillales bacterium 24-66-33]|jgi:K+-transporting ATPase KdpF subunit|nr:MAG: potassium-transporting ATPase subunit F [Rhodospirillales bacterium 35-66-84]OYZ92137.1 MAG: potassium-transporting ATPase subunit F [Rhodospirillales bacterium 24-66-33]OZB23540.1 MAG: potassium-transporting ATPase subunit F [Rhodospirillales bacterium 39-66-50]